MDKNFSMVAKHVINFQAEDKIFAASQAAADAARKFGKENVVNATVGAILDDEENLAILPTVVEAFRSITEAEIAAYAPIAGTPDFLSAAERAAFMDYRPEAYIRSAATPGGSGALRHAVWNYSNVGDSILTSDWYWGPYKSIAEGNLRRLETFEFFDEQKNFNISSFEVKVKELTLRQDSLVILLNSPAHNPTGFALDFSEWQQVVDILKQAASNKEKKIILVSDIAYIDYTKDAAESRQFMSLFSGLPENLLVIVAFSISKGLTMYGLRTGAAISISSSKAVTEEFFSACQYSNRGTWSNGTRCGMKLTSNIINDASLLSSVEKERDILRKLLEERAYIFTQEAKDCMLDICPYKAGFFVTIPSKDSDEACEKLKNDNIFAVPLAKGIRVAICSIPAKKIRGVASSIKAAVI